VRLAVVPASPLPDVLAAGVVAFRPGKRVLLVHRPKYDDWSFPKGKLERGEHAAAAAVREVAEETGLHVRLGPPLGSQRYPTGGRMKTVHYWTGRPLGDDDVSGYLVNAEIDDVEWVDASEAADRLTYAYDRDTLAEALRRRRSTTPLVVLRHSQARSRKAWQGDDRLRPLLQTGRQQAERLVPVLAAYGVSRVVTSSSLRCLETVTPYAGTTGWALEPDDRLSEEDASPKRVRRLVDDLVTDVTKDDRAAVLCTHRPVLPEVLEALGIDDSRLELGEMLVAHLRKGVVVAVERHLAR
jgi:8-oxo-dGTP pyrophosphatase MutT (NUDIX family)/phosphohistidine phosphatase SixA